MKTVIITLKSSIINMVMVNLMCNLTELKDAQIAGTT